MMKDHLDNQKETYSMNRMKGKSEEEIKMTNSIKMMKRQLKKENKQHIILMMKGQREELKR